MSTAKWNNLPRRALIRLIAPMEKEDNLKNPHRLKKEEKAFLLINMTDIKMIANVNTLVTRKLLLLVILGLVRLH